MKEKIIKISDNKVNVVFDGMSEGFYISSNPFRDVNFWKVTTKNRTDFLKCTNISISRVQKQLNKVNMGGLLSLNPLEIYFPSQLANSVVSNSMRKNFFLKEPTLAE